MFSSKPFSFRTTSEILFRILASCVLSVLLLTGCGSSRELSALQSYREEMNSFCSSIASCQEKMDALDASSSDAESQLLLLVDEMADAGSRAAALTPPEGLEDAGEMCRKASDYLQEAKGEYHAAFEAEPFDTDAFQKALSSYQSAGRCLALMAENLRESAKES